MNTPQLIAALREVDANTCRDEKTLGLIDEAADLLERQQAVIEPTRKFTREMTFWGDKRWEDIIEAIRALDGDKP